MNLKYLVTGTGRSGTVFMARLLTSIGLPCGHESVFGHRGIEAADRIMSGQESAHNSHASTTKFDGTRWLPDDGWSDTSALVAEASYLAAPYLSHPILSGSVVIHVVRDPVKVVQSFCNYIHYFSEPEPTNPYEEFIYARMPELRRVPGRYDRACLFWARWNRTVEAAGPALRHRVEDGTGPVLEFLGRSGEPHFSDDKVNSYKKVGVEHFSLHMIKSKEVYEEFVSTGRRYGYRMSSEYLLC